MLDLQISRKKVHTRTKINRCKPSKESSSGDGVFVASLAMYTWKLKIEDEDNKLGRSRYRPPISNVCPEPMIPFAM